MARAFGRLRRLGFPEMTIRVNNRKLAEGFYRGLGIEDTAAVLQRVDKFDKIGAAAVAELDDAAFGLAAVLCGKQQVYGIGGQGTAARDADAATARFAKVHAVKHQRDIVADAQHACAVGHHQRRAAAARDVVHRARHLGRIGHAQRLDVLAHRFDGALAQQQAHVVEVLGEADAPAARQHGPRAVYQARNADGRQQDQECIECRHRQIRLKMDNRNIRTRNASAKST